MAKDYTPHQRKLIQSYYRHRDAIDVQRLQEIVTEIFLARGAKALERQWGRAAEVLQRAKDLPAQDVERILRERDVEALAALAGQRFGSS